MKWSYIRARKAHEDKLFLEQKLHDSQVKVAKKWRQRGAYLTAKVVVAGLKAARDAEKLKTEREEEVFLQSMQRRMAEELEAQAVWHRDHPHVSLTRSRQHHDHDDSSSSDYYSKPPAAAAQAQPTRKKIGTSLVQPPHQELSLVVQTSTVPLTTTMTTTMTPGGGGRHQHRQQSPHQLSQREKTAELDPHIEALMMRYGQPSSQDGHCRKKRFYDIQLWSTYFNSQSLIWHF